MADDGLADFISAHAESDTCSFCERQADEPIAADADDVMAHIEQSLQREWDTPENVLFHDKESPTGWFGPEPADTADVLEQEGWPFDNERFEGFALAASSDTWWVPRDPYALSETEALAFSWELFAETVKHETRFVFALLPDDSGEHDDPGAPVRRGARFLREIGRLIDAYDLLVEIEPTDDLYRVRVRDAGEEVHTAADLGAPEAASASQSRMSPAGIPMLYCAREVDTVLGEVVDPDEDAGRVACIATFRTREPVRVVDLGRLPPAPSIFEPEESARERAELLFLHAFKRDLSAHIERDDRVHVEYVPTQVVSEYLRRVFRDGQGRPVFGLAFDSAQVDDGHNVVLFVQRQQCLEQGDPEPLIGGPVVERVAVEQRTI